MLQKKNNGKEYVFMKKSTNSLNIPEHAIIQLSFGYKFETNDEIVLKMNNLKFISPNMFSSYLIITSLKHK
uniref:Uncharacterized protein n=2 Tax=Octopus bimaculoides TaxID=37653 RepID=A0A0L8GKF7_OCTBM